jgi:hypothetical protein
VRILPLAGNNTVLPDTQLLLQGSAYDLEDGLLSESSLQWRSNNDGNLGTGRQVLITLTPGTHTITLSATDSDANTATQSFELFVGYKDYLPLIKSG